MRIGIITFHKSYNYGSALQAYALQTYLTSVGHDVKIIDFVYTSDFRQYHLFRTHLYKAHPKVFIRDIIRLSRNLKRKRSFENFQNQYFSVTDFSFTEHDSLDCLNSEFDCFICGSDQIWNLDCTNGIVPAYFLDFASSQKKLIAYAPSIAHIGMEGDRVELGKLLDRFDAISVREKSTISLLSDLVKNTVVDVADPTLLNPVSSYEKLEEGSNHGSYIFYYELQENNDMKKWCSELSEQKGLKIIYINKDNVETFRYGQNVFGVSPGTFLNLIHNAEYVVTNSFHATVFSILYQKQFLTFRTPGSSTRMVDLLNNLGIIDRLDVSKFDEKIDYKSVNEKLYKIVEESTVFLKNALEG